MNARLVSTLAERIVVTAKAHQCGAEVLPDGRVEVCCWAFDRRRGEWVRDAEKVSTFRELLNWLGY